MYNCIFYESLKIKLLTLLTVSIARLHVSPASTLVVLCFGSLFVSLMMRVSSELLKDNMAE